MATTQVSLPDGAWLRFLRVGVVSEAGSLECQLITDLANTAAWVTLPDDYFTPRSIRAASVWNLATRYGQLDLTFAPSAFPTGYDELRKRADRRPVAGTTVQSVLRIEPRIRRTSEPLADDA